MHGALHETIAFQTPQGLGQHLLGDPANLALERGVAHRAFGQNLNDERRPFVGDAVEHQPRRALGIQH